MGGREGVLTGSRGRGGHHRVGIGVILVGGPRWVCQSEWPCLGSFECPSFHLAGGSFLATFGLPMVSIKLSHNLGDHSTYNI